MPEQPVAVLTGLLVGIKIHINQLLLNPDKSLARDGRVRAGLQTAIMVLLLVRFQRRLPSLISGT